VLTGGITKVKGKEYRYPGLIEALQEYKLVIAEIIGEGPMMRYVFHVNLTPGLLTGEQLRQLPAVLRRKHEELIERCQQRQSELEAKRRPPKVTTSRADPPPKPQEEGSHNLLVEQHPINTTHRTTPSAREDHNNNSSDLHALSPDVVVALTGQGISEKVAKRLAGRYSKERIEEKITYLTFLHNEDPDKVQNPRGWLRRAIEEDYGPPDGFVTAAEQTRRAAEAAEAAQRAVAIEQQHQAFAVQAQARREDRRRQLQEEYGTTEADEQLWAEVLALFKASRPDLHDVYARAQILRCTEEAVWLGFEQEGMLRQLDHPGTMAALKRHLKLIAKRPLAVERVLLPVAALGVPEGAEADSIR
jgi:hypothetical protein